MPVDVCSPHLLSASGDDQASTGVPPQLEAINPWGTIKEKAGEKDGYCDSDNISGHSHL